MNLTGASSARSFRSLALKILLSLLLTALLLEAGAALVIHAGLIPSQLPSYRWPQPREPFFVDIDPHFGSWHPPNRTLEHRRACFATRYRSNSYGALDVERPRSAAGPRVVVLGDSFAVGHGVAESERFSNRLEQLTGIPHMNFAAGGTGPTQYFMVYKYLAREFSHDRVLVSILPDNDFAEGPVSDRYKPYWAGEPPNYELRYTLPRLEDSSFHPSKHDPGPTAHDILGAFSYLYNAADFVVGARKVMQHRSKAGDFAGYFDFTDAQFQRMRKSLLELHALAPGGRLAVMGMPRLIDLERYKQEQKNPFGDAMTQAAQEIGFQFVDMLPPMAKAFDGHLRDIYHACDGHWSKVGHDFAARELQRRLYQSQP